MTSSFYSKLFLSFLFSIISFSNISAQTEISIAETHRSEIIKPKKKAVIRAGITSGEHGHYILEVVNVKTANIITEAIKGSLRLLHYDKKLNLQQTKDLDILIRTYKGNLEYITILDKDLLLFAYLIDKKLNKKYLYQYSYDPITLEQIHEPKIIHESDYIGYNKDRNKFKFAVSADSSKFLIYEFNQLKKGKVELFVKVFNKKMELVWKNKTTSDKLDYKFTEWVNGVVSNNGDAFFLINIDRMLALNKDNHHFIDLKNVKEKNRILSIKLQLDSEQKPTIFGYYHHRKKKESGFLFIQSTSTNDPFDLKIKWTPFSEEFLSLHAKKQNPKKTPKLKTPRIRHIFQKSNNNFIVIGEENYSDDHSSGSGGSKKEWKLYYHKSFLLQEIGSDGNIIWSKKIAKNGGGERTPTDINFYAHQDADKIYLIYNAHPENLNYPGYGKIKKADGQIFNSKAQITIAQIDNDGEYNATPLYPISEVKVEKFYPRGSAKISGKEFLIIENNKREFELVKFKIEE